MRCPPSLTDTRVWKLSSRVASCRSGSPLEANAGRPSRTTCVEAWIMASLGMSERVRGNERCSETRNAGLLGRGRAKLSHARLQRSAPDGRRIAGIASHAVHLDRFGAGWGRCLCALCVCSDITHRDRHRAPPSTGSEAWLSKHVTGESRCAYCCEEGAMQCNAGRDAARWSADQERQHGSAESRTDTRHTDALRAHLLRGGIPRSPPGGRQLLRWDPRSGTLSWTWR